MAREGKQSFKVIDTDEKWILYHNCFSLCSRKVRLCLEELEIEYDQEHIDLIETGKYQVASKDFLKINPGATVPVLLHEGYPIYESHEQIYYLTEESSSSFIIPSAENDKKTMDYWVKKSSMVGDPMENQDIYKYSWQTNVGYGSKKHREVIMDQGLTKYHRLSFCRFYQT